MGYDSDGLALTGVGITLGGYFLDSAWLAVAALVMTALGFLALRLGRPRPINDDQ